MKDKTKILWAIGVGFIYLVFTYFTYLFIKQFILKYDVLIKYIKSSSLLRNCYFAFRASVILKSLSVLDRKAFYTQYLRVSKTELKL